MTFVVGRRDGSFEVRQSSVTAKGPRARTLATFRVLTPEVMDRAARRSAGSFDRARLQASARRAGAPVAPEAVDDAARGLLRRLSLDEKPAPVLRALLLDALDPSADVADHVRAAGGWAGASDGQRAEALHDLLLLADWLPSPRAQPAKRFPRLTSRAA